MGKSTTMCLTLSINGILQFVNGHHCPYMDCPEPTQECLFMGGEAVAVEAVAAAASMDYDMGKWRETKEDTVSMT